MKIGKALGRIGPAFIVGACIIGPGSVTLMSRTGSLYGYSMLWVSILSGALMCGFIVLFMRFGIYSDQTFLEVTRQKLGCVFAVLCGVSLASIGAAFQFGNCLGVTTGMEMLLSDVPKQAWPIGFTVAAIVFMFAFKRIYRIIEKMMAFFLLAMLAAFAINLVSAKPNLLEIVKGACVPTIPSNVDWVTIGGLIATTFVMSGVAFQSYAVKARGWGEKDLASGIMDTLMASVVVTLVGMVIMMTAAAVLFTKGIEVKNAEAMAMQLQNAFGNFGRIVFAVGFCLAAFSSFLTNALISGTFLSDGFGLGGEFNARSTKAFASCVLLIGLTTSLVIINYDKPTLSTASVTRSDPKVIAIAIGQAATLLAVPFGIIATIVVLFDKRVMKGRGLSLWTKAFVLFGAAVLISIAAMMYVKIQPTIAAIFAAPTAALR